jgi:hypothetical protein
MNRPAYGLRGTYVPILVIAIAGLVFVSSCLGHDIQSRCLLYPTNS